MSRCWLWGLLCEEIPAGIPCHSPTAGQSPQPCHPQPCHRHRRKWHFRKSRACFCGETLSRASLGVLLRLGGLSSHQQPWQILGNLMLLDNALLRSGARNSSCHELAKFNQKCSSEDSHGHPWRLNYFSLNILSTDEDFCRIFAWLTEQGWFPGKPCQNP